MCLGILDGTAAKLSFNVIGGTECSHTVQNSEVWGQCIFGVLICLDLSFVDITMQDQMVIYDNEKSQLGWARGACTRSAKSILSSFP